MSDLTAAQKSWLRIPKPYWDVKTEGVINIKAKEFITNAVANLKVLTEKGVVISISGGPRTGKRALAVLLLKNAFLLGISGLYITADELQEMVVGNEEIVEGETVERRATSVGILVVANFGEEHLRNFDKNYVIDIVNRRCLQNQCTVLVSNKSLEHLKKDKYSKESLVDILDSLVSFEANVVYPNLKKKELNQILFGENKDDC